MSRKSRNKKQQRFIAKERINYLFKLADKKALSGDFNLANRYVDLARKISMRYLVPIPAEFKRKFCKHCYSFLLSGVNSRIRIHRNKIIIFCSSCSRFSRIPLKKTKKNSSAMLK